MSLLSFILPGVGQKGGLQKYTVILLVLIFCLTAGLASAASGGSDATTWKTTDWYKVMNFAVLAIGLYLLLRKPISQALNARIEGIKDQLNELEESKKEAEKKLAEYNEKFNQLDAETDKIIAEYIKQGNAAKERILKEAEAAADKLEEQAKKNIENEFNKAKKQLKGEILEKSLAKAEEIIKSQINNQDQDRLVDEYLEKVVA